MTVRQFSVSRWQTAVAVAITLGLSMSFLQAAHAKTYAVLQVAGPAGELPFRSMDTCIEGRDPAWLGATDKAVAR